VEPTGTAAAKPNVTNPPVFEIQVADTIYYVGEDPGDVKNPGLTDRGVGKELAIYFENAIRQALLPFMPQNGLKCDSMHAVQFYYNQFCSALLLYKVVYSSHCFLFCYILVCSILPCFILVCFVLFYFGVLLGCIVLYLVLFYSDMFY